MNKKIQFSNSLRGDEDLSRKLQRHELQPFQFLHVVMFNELKKDKKLTSETNQEVLYFLNVTDEKACILSNHRKATEKSAICVLCVISSL